MQIFTKGKLFITLRVWFETEENVESNFFLGGGYDNLSINANPSALSRIGKYPCTAEKQMTLISDISKPQEELWAVLTKTLRNEINRAKREEVEIRTYRAGEVTDALLDDFDETYRKMYAEKGITGRKLDRGELKAYAENDALLISVASIDGVPVVYHSYVFDSTHSRFLQSCSVFRNGDNAMRQSIGRANKYLHWNDWMLLKEMGIREYDWGGIASYDEPNGIDRFKMEFGGMYREYYNLYAVCSLRSRIFQLIRKVINR